MVIALYCLSKSSMGRDCFKVSSLLIVGVLFVLFGIGESKICTQIGNCKCVFDDGSGTVDLSPLGRRDGKLLIQDTFAPDNYAYSFNPCYPFTEGTCVNAAACQYDSNNNIYYNIGDSSKVTLSYDGLNVMGVYISDDGVRSSRVTFMCDPKKDPPDTQANGETSTAFYAFTVASKYACPQRRPSTEGPSTNTTGNGPSTEGPRTNTTGNGPSTEGPSTNTTGNGPRTKGPSTNTTGNGTSTEGPSPNTTRNCPVNRARSQGSLSELCLVLLICIINLKIFTYIS